MTTRTRPPFRADHVGSFLRPQRLLEARERRSQGALSAYIPELFPMEIRASATGFCFNLGRLFTATAVFFVGALVSFLGGYSNTLFIFSFIFLAGLLATWFARDKQ